MHPQGPYRELLEARAENRRLRMQIVKLKGEVNRLSELNERLQDRVEVSREMRDTAENRAKEVVQAEMAALRAQISGMKEAISEASREWFIEKQQLESQIERYKFAPLGDNHHNAAMCPHCRPSLDSATSAPSR